MVANFPLKNSSCCIGLQVHISKQCLTQSRKERREKLLKIMKNGLNLTTPLCGFAHLRLGMDCLCLDRFSVDSLKNLERINHFIHYP